jgi:hypothetical protein
MEIGVAVQPPRGVAFVLLRAHRLRHPLGELLTEEPGALPNWVAAAGIMDLV